MIISEKTIAFIFVFLTIYGFSLRFYGLTDQSLWFDELFSTIHSSNPNSLSELINDIKGDVHPPGYQILLYYWIKIFGDSDYSVRSLSASFNILSICAVSALYYYNIKKDKLISLSLGASLSACSILLWYSQETRSYCILASLGAIGILFTAIYEREEKKNIKPIAISLFLVLLLEAWTHYLGLIWSGSIIITSLGYNIFRKDLRKITFWFLTGVFIVISYVPWILYSIAESSKLRPMGHIPPAGFFFPFTSMFPFFGRGFIIYFPILLFLTIREFIYFRKNSSYLFLFSIIFLYFAILFSLQIFVNLPMINERNTIIVSAAYIILLSLSSELNEKYRKFFYILLICASALQLHDFKKYTKKNLKKEDYKNTSIEALNTKRDLETKNKSQLFFVSIHPDLQSHYLPGEKIEKCVANDEFHNKDKTQGSYIIYLWGHLEGSFTNNPTRHCIFTKYEIVKEEVFYHAGFVLLKKKI
ncbi:hypothetical protein LEP1GSC185_0143 [Leptospira licerasiae serovar Varillal str. VAR 010]|nr:hypothetical protein LEP1GSC185_0143 [Leptospira licerasiae serovar Varillal str. VAR 010]